MHYNLAHHLLELKDTQGAVDAMRQAVALAPAPDYLLRLGQAREQAGHRYQAIIAYRRTLSSDRLDPAGGASLSDARERLRAIAQRDDMTRR